MRDAETIETELMKISAIADDSVKFERRITFAGSHKRDRANQKKRGAIQKPLTQR